MARKNCDECIAELAAFIVEEIPPRWLPDKSDSVTSMESKAEAIIGFFGNDGRFIAKMRPLVKIDIEATENIRAWISAVKEALHRIVRRISGFSTEGAVA